MLRGPTACHAATSGCRPWRVAGVSFRIFVAHLSRVLRTPWRVVRL